MMRATCAGRGGRCATGSPSLRKDFAYEKRIAVSSGAVGGGCSGIGRKGCALGARIAGRTCADQARRWGFVLATAVFVQQEKADRNSTTQQHEANRARLEGWLCSRLTRRLEAAAGFEPAIRALQARALPLGYAAIRTTRWASPWDRRLRRNPYREPVNRELGVTST